ncbi:MAG: fibronectin type III domain-containing protein [Lachnospiraceae bacterium]|nr:fibronectin type III domain-containing protein [Lachnospiraceae bacterium]
MYYWNMQSADYNNKLYTIDPVSKIVADTGNAEDKLYAIMVCVCKAQIGGVPATPQITAIDFPAGSLSGHVAMTMPTKKDTGEDLSGQLTWTAYLDSQKYSDGKAAPGEVVSVDFTNLTEGIHAFSFTVTNGADTSKEALQTAYIGVDTPIAPENVVLTESSVSWTAVDKGLNGGYIDLGNLQYEVSLNNEPLGTTVETSMTVALPSTGNLKLYSASVKAISGGKSSQAAVSNSIVAGDAMALPMVITPTAEEAELCSYIDGNGDGNTWKYDESKGCFNSGFCETSALNDWLILPPVELKAGSKYEFSMNVWRNSSFFNEEYIEVRYGKAPQADAMTNILIEKMTAPAEVETVDAILEALESGKYYIALHSLSDADMYGVNVNNIKLIDTHSEITSVASVSDLRAEAAPNGELKATVYFTLPDKMTDGSAIQADAKLTAVVEGASKVTVEGTPGASVNAVVETLQGMNKINVTPGLGELNGIKLTVAVYTGETLPDKITDLKAQVSEDMKSAKLTWNAPTAGVDGGYIDPANLTYNVYQLVSTSMGDVWQEVATGVKETSYNFIPEQLMQDYYELCVRACNIAGETPTDVETYALLGVPHSLPMSDTFDIGTYTYNPWVVYTPTQEYQTQWGLLPLEVIPFVKEMGGNAICGMGHVPNCKGKAGMPVFTTKGYDQVHTEFMFWTGDQCASNITITGQCFGMTDEVIVGTVQSKGLWTTVDFDLPKEMVGKDWVRLYLNADFPEGTENWVIMKYYKIAEGAAAGLAQNVADNALTVACVPGGLRIMTSEAAAISIYTPDGILVNTLEAAPGETFIPLERNIYIVTSGNSRQKIAVK